MYSALSLSIWFLCNLQWLRKSNTKFVTWKWSATKNVVTVLVAIRTGENSSESPILFHWITENVFGEFQKETGVLLMWQQRGCGSFLLVMYKVLLTSSASAFSEGISSWWATSVFGYFLTEDTIVLKWIS